MKASVNGLICTLLVLMTSFLSFGQKITMEEMMLYKSWPRFQALSQLYNFNDSNFLWVNHPEQRQELLDLLHLSSSLGLNEENYQYDFVQGFGKEKKPRTKADSVEADLRFSDAALHFFTEVQTGNKRPSFGYNGLKYSPDVSQLPAQISSHLRDGNLKVCSINYSPVQ